MDKRTVFTIKENQFLLLLIQKRKKNVECKETKNFKNKRKNDACINIEKEFNDYLGVTCRIAKQLRQKYCFYILCFRFSMASINLGVKISSI